MESRPLITKIISGGQTGADQAALDAAIKTGISHGGWIPKGRRTENGILPDRYKLKEMPTSNYPKRTEQNILDSDGTLITSHGNLTGGSSLTRKLAKKHNRPWIHIDLTKTDTAQAAKSIHSWLDRNNIQTLNVAGARASKDPKIYEATTHLLRCFLDQSSE